MSKEGDLRIWWVPQVPMSPFNVPVKSVEEAAVILNVLSEYDAFQFVNKVKPDYCNEGGLEVFEMGEWVSWQDDETFSEEPDEDFPQPSLGWCAKL